MIVLGIDFETTGLDPKTSRVIEVGAVLWDTSTAMPLKIFSEFCWDENMPTIEPEALAAHGLNAELLSTYGRPQYEVFGRLRNILPPLDAFVGHNCIQFDKPFYEMEMKLAKLECENAPWIDTTTDLKYPPTITTRKLTHLAAEHGFLNPFAHRAVFDVLTMLKIFQQYDTDAARAFAMEPMVTLAAIVSYDDRQKAKDRGYRWKNETRQWLKSCRQSDARVEQLAAGFKVIEVST